MDDAAPCLLCASFRFLPSHRAGSNWFQIDLRILIACINPYPLTAGTRPFATAPTQRCHGRSGASPRRSASMCWPICDRVRHSALRSSRRAAVSAGAVSWASAR